MQRLRKEKHGRRIQVQKRTNKLIDAQHLAAGGSDPSHQSVVKSHVLVMKIPGMKEMINAGKGVDVTDEMWDPFQPAVQEILVKTFQKSPFRYRPRKTG